MIAVAPGKLILSGEHSAVHGRPAIAMAIDRRAETTVTSGSKENVSFSLANYGSRQSFTLLALRDAQRRIATSYRLFQDGDLGICEVLLKPVELFQRFDVKHQNTC